VIRDRKELLQLLPTIVFSHDDILFAGGPPERRRWFMDQTLSLYDPLYVDQLRRYRKLLKERNHLLKTRRTDLLDHYGEQLAFSGLALRERRSSLTTEFGAIFEPLFREVSGLDMPVTLRYRPSWGEADDSGEVLTILREKREAELGMGTTLSGPHRDRFLFLSGNIDFSKSASTGQLRLLSLVLRVAQAQFYVATTGRLPILLLDDVLLELDPRRRLLFREHLPDYEQCVYTFLPGEEIGHHGEDAKVYTVKDGRFFDG
jgi:DNA replication and repair protein RecF